MQKSHAEAQVPSLNVAFDHSKTLNKQDPDNKGVTSGSSRLLSCPLCSSAFAKTEYFVGHLEVQHNSSLANPNRKGWISGTQVFQLDLKLDAALWDLSLAVRCISQSQFVLKNILVAEQKKPFERLEHNITEKLGYGLIPVHGSLFKAAKLKYRFVLFAVNEEGLQIEEHHLMTFEKPYQELIDQFRKQEVDSMRPEEGKTQRDKEKLPTHVSNPKIREYFDDKWYLITPRPAKKPIKDKPITGEPTTETPPIPQEHKLLLDLENNENLTVGNYVKAMKLLNAVEDLHVLEKVEEAVFEYKTIAIEPSGVYYVEVNLHDLSKLCGVIGENDFIVLQQMGANRETKGLIEGIESGRLYFTIAPWQLVSTKHKFNIFFEKNRTPLRMEQAALTNLAPESIQDYLFPTKFGEMLQSNQM